MPDADLRGELKQFIISNFMLDADSANFKDSASLLKEGLIDSMGVLEIVAHLKKHYGVQAPAGDIVPQNFDSVEALEKYIRRMTPKSSGSSR